MIGLLRLGIEWRGAPSHPLAARRGARASAARRGDPAVEYGTWEVLREGRPRAPGHRDHGAPALAAAERARREGIDATVVNCRFIKPLDEACLARLFPGHGHALTVEEGTVVNGFGAYVRARIAEAGPGSHGAAMGLPGRLRGARRARRAAGRGGAHRRGDRGTRRALLGAAAGELLRDGLSLPDPRRGAAPDRRGRHPALRHAPGATLDRVVAARRAARARAVLRGRAAPLARPAALTPEVAPGWTCCSRSAATGRCCAGARLVAPHGVPVLGVNLGHLGLPHLDRPRRAGGGARTLAGGRDRVDERMVLAVDAESADGRTRTRLPRAQRRGAPPRAASPA
jgi:hypothetical protein